MSNTGGNDRPLVGLVGPAGSGKDTLAGFLVADHGFRRLAFADAIKAFTAAIDPAFRIAAACFEGGVDAAKRHVPGIRERLIEVGRAARMHITGSVWVDAVDDALESLPASVSVVVSDVRQPNEAEWLFDRGGILVAVHRPGLRPENRDMASLLEAADWTVENIGEIGELEEKAEELVTWLELEKW